VAAAVTFGATIMRDGSYKLARHAMLATLVEATATMAAQN
jgi:hypothetical protein